MQIVAADQIISVIGWLRGRAANDTCASSNERSHGNIEPNLFCEPGRQLQSAQFLKRQQSTNRATFYDDRHWPIPDWQLPGRRRGKAEVEARRRRGVIESRLSPAAQSRPHETFRGKAAAVSRPRARKRYRDAEIEKQRTASVKSRPASIEPSRGLDYEPDRFVRRD
jgi:hypothetical protein